MRLAILGALGAGLYLATRPDEPGRGIGTAWAHDTPGPRTDTDTGQAPRGIRNNNPGNLENNGIPWQGLASRQTDPRFYQFSDAVFGIRALARTLKTYRETHGLQSAYDIISRWAPAFENNVESYARAVAAAVGADPYSPLPDDDRSRLRIVKAIIKHENGLQPYPDDLIAEGIKRAYT